MVKAFLPCNYFCGYLSCIVPGVFGYKYKGLLDWTQIGQYEQQKAKDDAISDEYFSVYKMQPVEELAKMPEAVASGRRIFLQNCAVCHGQNAKGAAIGYPNLTDNDWLWGGDGETLIKTITEGRNTIPGQGMPAGGALITDPANPSAEDLQKVKAVANYIRSMGGHDDVDQSLLAKGKEYYDQSCVACHGAEGQGNPMLGAPNIADDIWLYSKDGSVADIEHQILHPANNMMPAWSDRLGPGRIKVVAAYIYSLSHKE